MQNRKSCAHRRRLYEQSTLCGSGSFKIPQVDQILYNIIHTLWQNDVYGSTGLLNLSENIQMAIEANIHMFESNHECCLVWSNTFFLNTNM